MKFSEKLKELRKNANFTQAEMAENIGVSLRTYKNYELGENHPRKREIYHVLAIVLGCDVNYLLTEDEEFLTAASEKYGPGGRLQAEKVIQDVAGLFAGGELSDVDKDAVMQALQQVYWDSKEENKKYTPKKYLERDSK